MKLSCKYLTLLLERVPFSPVRLMQGFLTGGARLPRGAYANFYGGVSSNAFTTLRDIRFDLSLRSYTRLPSKPSTEAS